ncbi:ABC transporter ATP-binding protein [Campylobacter gastrosuis]|uniref:ATP-binding cassette domain-containing protein n=1 Tax=Campylobacter gastrosuis TaxID=2974576 RepID=A0ABT7HND0_9BACT|nr:ATP-binding cassette domain-containing protein [Campylobacter gastrosuis]MDL0088421.1 ATP-binding cassette domain-containing protein [Campylobacter gastrosuis]
MIEIRNLRKKFLNTEVLKDINLFVKNGEFCVLLGASGCGKSTLLNILSATLEFESGEILVDKKSYKKRLKLDKTRQIITQTYSLMPWLNAVENIKLALKCYGVKDKNEREEIALKFLDMVGLLDKKDSFIHSLSGGQKQRVAIARALSLNPEILLLDEPFSALDPITRANLQKMLKILLKNTTTIFVTHDIDEALILADKIVILYDGVVIQTLKNPNLSPKDPSYFELKAKIFRLLSGVDDEVEYNI